MKRSFHLSSDAENLRARLALHRAMIASVQCRQRRHLRADNELLKRALCVRVSFFGLIKEMLCLPKRGA